MTRPPRPSPEQRYCKKCHQEGKTFTARYNNNRGKHYFRWMCDDCFREDRRKYYERKKERQRPVPQIEDGKTVLEYIRDNEPCTTNEIAIGIGMHYNTVRNRLITVENSGTLLWEDASGQIGIFRKLSCEECLEVGV